MGMILEKGRWKIDPTVNPDTYQALMALNQNYKLVTFITDVDSLQLRVEKGKTYPFVIIVNDKDSAFTQVQGGSHPLRSPRSISNRIKERLLLKYRQCMNWLMSLLL